MSYHGDPHPPSSASAPESSAKGGIRIAGMASRIQTPAHANTSSPAPQSEPSIAPARLDRNRHPSSSSPPKPIDIHGRPSDRAPRPSSASNGHGRGGTGAYARPSFDDHDDDDDDDEEGAIDDPADLRQRQPQARPDRTTSPSAWRPPPPKTPPHPSSASQRSSQRPDAADRKDSSARDSHRGYQPRSPSPPRGPSRTTETSSTLLSSSNKAPSSAAYVPRSPSPRGREADSRPSHPPSEPRNYRAQADTYPARGWERPKERHSDPKRGWGMEQRPERPWGGAPRGHMQNERDFDRRRDLRDGPREMDMDRDRAHDRQRGYRNEWDRPREPDARYRKGREREHSPSAQNKDRYQGWSPTPPHPKAETQPNDAQPRENGRRQADAYPPRPPSRMGRGEPPPTFSRPENPSGQQLEHERPPKRPASPTHRSPPAGLLKRKPNFSAVVPLAVAAVVASPPKEDTSAPGSANVAPGAPIHPKINTLESPVLPSAAGSRLGSESVSGALAGSRPGSTLPTALGGGAAATGSGAAAAVPIDANFDATCDALDDPECPSVRLSSLPRKRPDVPVSGRERRKARPPPVPLNQRKFVGCSSLDDYEISIKLGQGTFGEVLKGRQILTGTQVALKKVTIHDAKDGLPITALREIKLLKKLKHPSIVPVIDMAYRPSGERGKLGDVYMVEPYMDHDLNGMLENPSIRLEHSQIKLYMKQLLEGTLYLHKNRILHRDMKAANLLINNNGQLQIADFGLARPYRDPGQSWTGKGWTGGTHRYTNMVVTRWYRPPELLAGEKKYGPPIDMWGIGCILAEMIMGKPLFKGTSELNQLELIAKLCGSPDEASFPGWKSLPGVKDADPTGRPDPHPEIPGQHDFGAYPRRVKEQFRNLYDAGPGCADLIDKLLVLDPTKRLTAQQALAHEWFWTKPFPADPASLPKYEHSKEIDRARREWKPAPAPAPAPAAAQGAVPAVGGSMVPKAVRPMAQMGGAIQPQQVRPYGRGAYPPPAMANGAGGPPMGQMDMPPMGASAWDSPAPPGPGAYAQQRPSYQPRPYPSATRHPFPGASQMHEPHNRFPHPGQQRPPHHGPPRGQGLPQRPNVRPSHAPGPRPHNPYS